MIEFHPLANLFPMIDGAAADELAGDIRQNGVREPIVIHELKILDGRNRYVQGIAAGVIEDWMTIGDLQKVGVPIRFYDEEGEGDPLAFVLSLNLHRRHLSESQRAMIAADIGKLRQGRPAEWSRNPDDPDKPASLPDSLSQAERGRQLGISERQVRTGDFVKEHAAPELADSVRRGEVKVSAAADLARLDEEDQLEILRTVEPRLIGRVARERVGNGGRATLASRVEPTDSFDFFPTPPWGTRTLIEDVLRLPRDEMAMLVAWDPAGGEGHVSGVLQEYFGTVIATDIFDYSQDGRSAPGWISTLDFLSNETTPEDLAEGQDVDWIITNPPFSGEGDRALAFALRALKIAKGGVALFVRTQWLEGINRYNQLFSVTPPTVVAQFAERISLFRGVWDPDGSKPDQYCWLVWDKGDLGPCGFEWIRPGRQVERTLLTDEARFMAHPVLRISPAQVAPQGAAAEGEGGAVTDAALPQVRMTKAEAEPILIARYATTDVEELSVEFGGVPINTIRSWAFKLGLTSVKRRSEQLAERNRLRGKIHQEPNHAV